MASKQELLKTLEEHRGESLSGSLLAGQLGVTRSAVWKLIGELREEGYEIQAVQNRGYCLATTNDLLSEAGIRPFLRTEQLGRNLLVYKTVDSTNRELKRLAHNGAAHGTVVIAEQQTAGRGRMGRSFYSPERSGIYMSVLLRPQIGAQQSLLITSGAAVSVARAIHTVAGIEAEIKWVNDLYVGGKKICGILTEAGMDFESGSFDYIVVGIGVNVAEPEQGFPEELRAIVGALQSGTPTLRRSLLIAEILNNLEPIYAALPGNAFLEEYRQRSMVIGRDIYILSGASREAARALDIDEEGRLLVRGAGGEERILGSGEISIRLANE